MQCILLFIFLIDAVLLTLHYYFDLWPTHFEYASSDRVYAIQDETWLRLRISFKILQMIIMTVLLVATSLVFGELAKVINRDENLKPLKKQVYIFMTVFLA